MLVTMDSLVMDGLTDHKQQCNAVSASDVVIGAAERGVVTPRTRCVHSVRSFLCDDSGERGGGCGERARGGEVIGCLTVQRETAE